MTKKMCSTRAASEVIGVVLLLGITISLFAILNFTVFHFSFDPSVTSVNLIGTIDKDNSMIYIEHIGGESLEGNTEVIITIETSTETHTYRNSTSEISRDIGRWNLIEINPDKNDDKWDFGETVRFHSPELMINKYIRVDVVDPVKNSIILSIAL
jgi:flagellin-like protein